MDKKEVLAVLGKLAGKDKGSRYGWIVDSYPHPKRSDLGDDVIAVLDRMKDGGCAWDRSLREYIWMGTDVDDPDYIAYADDEETGEEVFTPYRAVIDRIVADHQGEPLVIVAAVVNDHDGDDLEGFVAQIPESAGIEYDVVRVERSEDDGQPTAEIVQGISVDVKERNVLLLTWAVATGCTAACVAAYLREKNASSVAVCAVLEDAAQQEFDVTVDYRVVEFEHKAVIGVAKGDGFTFPCLAI